MTITVEIDGKSAELKLTDEQIIEIGKKFFEVASSRVDEVEIRKQPIIPETVLLCTNTSATNTELNVANSTK